jgi:ATP/maltotriose-dependent transcriptional regulator MalT
VSLGAAGDVLREWPSLRRGIVAGVGEGHPQTLECDLNAALALAYQGQHERALPLAERVLAGFSDVLGADNLQTLGTVVTVGELLVCRGDVPRALRVLTDARETCERVYGASHPATLKCSHAAALAALRSGDIAAARRGFESVARARHEALAPRHHLTLVSVVMEALTSVLLDDAGIGVVDTLLDARRGLVAALSEGHADVLLCDGVRARALLSRGDSAGAAAVCDAALAVAAAASSDLGQQGGGTAHPHPHVATLTQLRRAAAGEPV